MSDEERQKWDARYSVPGYRKGEDPASWLAAQEPVLPRQGRALDLAAGEGQNAVWLASLGLDTVAIDISPMAQRKAAVLAAEWGVSLDYRIADLDLDASVLEPEGYDVITCFHFLQRELVEAMGRALRPGGVLVVEILGHANLERHPRPSARYLLAEGELRTWWPTLTELAYEEGWADGVYVCRRVMGRGAGV